MGQRHKGTVAGMPPESPLRDERGPQKCSHLPEAPERDWKIAELCLLWA